MKYIMGRGQRVDGEKWTHLSSYVQPRIYGHQNVTNSLLFVFSADDNKKPVTVWAKYSNASERSYLALLENAMYYWILSYHQQDVNH